MKESERKLIKSGLYTQMIMTINQEIWPHIQTAYLQTFTLRSSSDQAASNSHFKVHQFSPFSNAHHSDVLNVPNSSADCSGNLPSNIHIKIINLSQKSVCLDASTLISSTLTMCQKPSSPLRGYQFNDVKIWSSITTLLTVKTNSFTSVSIIQSSNYYILPAPSMRTKMKLPKHHETTTKNGLNGPKDTPWEAPQPPWTLLNPGSCLSVFLH